jgi:DNA-binding NarL/FixJ family response regulator
LVERFHRIPCISIAFTFERNILSDVKGRTFLAQGDSVGQAESIDKAEQRECALLAAQGLHNRDIAKKLGKSEITVRNQLSSIYRKLGIDTRHKLVAAFSRLGT